MAGALKGEGDAARYQGEFDQAENAYGAAIEIAKTEWRAALPSLFDGLGLVSLVCGDLDIAKDNLVKALDLAKVEGQKRYQVMFTADLAAVEMLAGRAPAAMELLERVEQGVAGIDRIDEHMQWALERALTAKLAVRHPEVVERAGDLAAKLWERIGRFEDAHRVRSTLEQLGYGITARG